MGLEPSQYNMYITRGVFCVFAGIWLFAMPSGDASESTPKTGREAFLEQMADIAQEMQEWHNQRDLRRILGYYKLQRDTIEDWQLQHNYYSALLQSDETKQDRSQDEAV